MSDQLFSLISTLLAVLTGAAVSWFTLTADRRRVGQQEATNTAIVVLGELRRMEKHFGYSNDELPAIGILDDTQGSMIKYGELRCLSLGLERLSQLGGISVEKILEIDALSRNLNFAVDATVSISNEELIGNAPTVKRAMSDLKRRITELQKMAAYSARVIEAAHPKAANLLNAEIIS